MFQISQVEANFLFLLNFYATFASEGVPPMTHFQASRGQSSISFPQLLVMKKNETILPLVQEAFYKIAQCHGFFAPKTKVKIIKDRFIYSANKQIFWRGSASNVFQKMVRNGPRPLQVKQGLCVSMGWSLLLALLQAGHWVYLGLENHFFGWGWPLYDQPGL